MQKIVLAKKLADLGDEDRKEVISFAKELAGRTPAAKSGKKKKVIKRKRRTKAEMEAARAKEKAAEAADRKKKKEAKAKAKEKKDTKAAAMGAADVPATFD